MIDNQFATLAVLIALTAAFLVSLWIDLRQASPRRQPGPRRPGA